MSDDDPDLLADFDSYGDASDSMSSANEELTAAAGGSGSEQAEAGQAMQGSPFTAEAGQALDKIHGTLDDGLNAAKEVTGADADDLTTAGKTLKAADDNVAANARDIPMTEPTGGEATPSGRIASLLSGSDDDAPAPGDNDSLPGGTLPEGATAPDAAPAATEPIDEPKSPLNFDDNGNPLPPSRAGTAPDATNGRYSEPQGPEWDDVRSAATQGADASPRPPEPGDPKMAAALKMSDEAYARVSANNPDAQQIYTNTSGTDIDLNDYPQLKGVIDSIPADKASEYDWRCAEIPNLTDALKDGYTINDFEGAQSSAAQIRGLQSANHGAWREPCDGDKYLLGKLGIEW
jgi:hypothetical protein